MLGQNCYIQQFLDHTPGTGVSDFRCSGMSYEGHKGTDFGLVSLAQQAEGVNVLAAADGIVRGLRDGMDDILWANGVPNVAGRECGNGVVLTHEAGYETQYCHLAKGSIVPRQGQRVQAGDVIGQVGLSGKTQFPHLHLSVRQDGQEIDPFDPDGVIACGLPDQNTLWNEPLHVPEGGVIAAGFSYSVPEYADIKAGTAHTDDLPSNTPALVMWGYMFASQPGDEVIINFHGPNGYRYESRSALDRAQALLFRAGGRNAPTASFPIGIYEGTFSLLRDGTVLDRATATITIGR
jgi:hypothetical protein